MVLRRCESYRMHQQFFWKGSLTGKAVVLKTTARSACGFESCPFRQSIVEASPKWYGSGLLNRRALRVQVQLLSPPPNSWTCSSVETEHDFAEVEAARSNRARSTKLRSGPVGKARVSETRLRRSNPASVVNTRVVQLAGDDRFRLCTLCVRIPPRVPMGMNAKWKAG
jgi:hypothetical protein